MKLKQALGIDHDSRVAFVGSGGKTTAIFQIAREFSSPVIVTTTTHLGSWQAVLADQHHVISRPGQIRVLADRIKQVTLLTGESDSTDRLTGLSDNYLAEIFLVADSLKCPVLIEADGSRGKPLKAPAVYEPAIPAGVNHVVMCVGASAVGAPLDDDHVHRPILFSELSGISLGGEIKLSGIARYLLSPDGGLKHIPVQLKKSVLFNQVDEDHFLDEFIRIAIILTTHFNTIILCSLQKQKIWATISRGLTQNRHAKCAITTR